MPARDQYQAKTDLIGGKMSVLKEAYGEYQLGHSSPIMTLNIYGHLIAESVEPVLLKADALIGRRCQAGTSASKGRLTSKIRGNEQGGEHEQKSHARRKRPNQRSI